MRPAEGSRTRRIIVTFVLAIIGARALLAAGSGSAVPSPNDPIAQAIYRVGAGVVAALAAFAWIED